MTDSHTDIYDPPLDSRERVEYLEDVLGDLCAELDKEYFLIHADGTVVRERTATFYKGNPDLFAELVAAGSRVVSELERARAAAGAAS